MKCLIGRFLLPEEEVHHINGIITDGNTKKKEEL